MLRVRHILLCFTVQNGCVAAQIKNINIQLSESGALGRTHASGQLLCQN